ncbi:LysM peptidoglycan-binding domain-containing protein [Sedimentibacter sp. zth1]|uniref:glycosyl hydrolase family 18 protein n=1 Tax=Sedimentibacter sp. zth1 TaxID=2816908 RepID=UPI001A92CFFB|nr:glycosyl hydrolase family 18 protein [Sedimentibacter sp. zth1]QSX05159.1 LysM peptidoglycan-binding domain-containing protein [Sedimentibacter sp. zth1]
MIFHVVRPGDTVYKLSKIYCVKPLEIIKDNGLINPNELIIGQVLIIDKEKNENKESINVFGYAYPNINDNALASALPYLTALYNFSYTINSDGSLSNLDDEYLIKSAVNFDTVPIMVITNLDENDEFNSEKLSNILNNEELQDIVIQNILNVVKEKGYGGVDVDFEYIYPEDEEEYENFLNKLATVLRSEGYILTAALAPKESSEQKGILYEAHDYATVGDIVDNVLLMTYEWGYIAGEPMAVAPIDKIEKVLDYAITQIENEKIILGIPNYGYDWNIPFKPETRAKVISNTEAIEIAKKYGAEIEFDEKAQSPYFRYYDENEDQHEVWFEDARSINSKLELVDKYDLGGVFYWNIMNPFPQNWTVLENTYNTKRDI